MAFSCGDRLHRQAFFLSLSGNMLLDLPVRPTGFFLPIFCPWDYLLQSRSAGFLLLALVLLLPTFSMVCPYDFFCGGFSSLGLSEAESHFDDEINKQDLQ
ncbi:hypothetical protein AYI96_03355 [Shewanella sp. MSW]|jgi:hypothetical protein|nr:hypothetical protein BFS86_13140 [Shewanella algae]TVP12874.1 hypothetical protein AYI96_03355 [Shewanella sp. MSW]